MKSVVCLTIKALTPRFNPGREGVHEAFDRLRRDVETGENNEPVGIDLQLRRRVLGKAV
jgi:hypothetical protein